MNKYKVLSFVVLALCLSPLAFGHPPKPEQKKMVVNRPQLKEQMGQLVVSMADLDLLINRDKTTDFEIFKEDGDRILKAIQKIRELDQKLVFKNYLDELQKPADQFVKQSERKSKKAITSFNEMTLVCFGCHKVHRDLK